MNQVGVNELDELIAGFLLSSRARGRSPRTIAWYEEKLRRFAAFAGARGVTRLVNMEGPPHAVP